MAKQTGLGDYLACDNSSGALKDVSNDITNIGITQNQQLLDSTGIDKSAMERLIGLGDVSFDISGVFNSAADMSHAVFSTLSGIRTISYAIGGNSSSNPILTTECLLSNYNLTRATDGSLTFTVNAALQSGTVPAWSTV
jgi:hypothetical protein